MSVDPPTSSSEDSMESTSSTHQDTGPDLDLSAETMVVAVQEEMVVLQEEMAEDP